MFADQNLSYKKGFEDSMEVIRRYDEVLSLKASKHSVKKLQVDLEKRLKEELVKFEEMTAEVNRKGEQTVKLLAEVEVHCEKMARDLVNQQVHVFEERFCYDEPI